MKLSTLAAVAILATAASPMAFADNHEGGDHKGGMFEKMDANGDGMISKAEFMAKHEEKFKKMDTNGDGQISKDERHAMREKWKDMKDHKGMDKPADESADAPAE